MIEDSIAIITNYCWKESINNINKILSDKQMINFNMNDYYYLTEIYQLGRPKLGELATKLNLTKPAISALTKRLERNDLITKAQSDKDKRVYYLTLTEKGIKIIQGDNDLYSKLSLLLKDLLTNEQVNMIDDLLLKIVENFKKQSTMEGAE